MRKRLIVPLLLLSLVGCKKEEPGPAPVPSPSIAEDVSKSSRFEISAQEKFDDIDQNTRIILLLRDKTTGQQYLALSGGSGATALVAVPPAPATTSGGAQ